MRYDARSGRTARRFLLVGAAAALGSATPGGPAGAQEVEYTGGVQAATGDYLFTERTTSFAFLNGLSLAFGRVRLSATLPLLYQNSTALTYIGGTPVPTGGPDAAAVRDRQGGGRVPMGPGRGSGGNGPGPNGSRAPAALAAAEEATAQVVAGPGDYQFDLGDPLLQVGVALHQGYGIVRSVGAHALAKAPVADVESGIGTGEWDYGAGATLALGGDRTFVLADASYWVVGDMPDLPLRNTLTYGLSVGRALGSGRWSVTGSLMGATAMIESADPPVSLGLGVAHSSGSARGFTAGVSVGLTESAADVSSYVGWRFRLGGGAP